MHADTIELTKTFWTSAANARYPMCNLGALSSTQQNNDKEPLLGEPLELAMDTHKTIQLATQKHAINLILSLQLGLYKTRRVSAAAFYNKH